MSLFDGKRLPKESLQLDVEGLRRGFYSDAYFNNTTTLLTALSEEGYALDGVAIGDVEVEMQYFARRQPFTVVAGVDEALSMLQECTGYYDAEGHFVNTYSRLFIEAVPDGTIARFGGDPQQVEPVLKIRGRYRDIAKLETPILGTLTEASRIATNVYRTVEAARGKDILFFPARFAPYQVQKLHGYAYKIGIDSGNDRLGTKSKVFVSTDAQAAYWSGKGGGTVSHATIASFLGNTTETMLQFSRILPPEVPRIALVDFHNDCVGDTKRVLEAMFRRYWQLFEDGNIAEASRYRLFGVRLDTAGNMRDASVEPLGDKELDCGVCPRLVWNVRQAIDSSPSTWEGLDNAGRLAAEEYCAGVKIVATGGFNVERIARFEELGIPVDIYGVGSSLLENSSRTNTRNDYTADIVRVRIGNEWRHLSKKGRAIGSNPHLKLISSPQ